MNTLLRSFILAFAILFSAPATQASAAETPVGVVEQAIGRAQITHSETGEIEDVKADATIHLNDIIRTADADSLVKVRFLDNGTITMTGMNGQLIVDEFFYDPSQPEDNRARYKILKASFEFVGGLMDKVTGNNREPDVQIQLDLGSIGIRGTHLYRTMKDGECYIWLEEGSIDVFNGGGRVSLSPGEGTKLPGVLDAPLSPVPWNAEQVNWIKSSVVVN